MKNIFKIFAFAICGVVAAAGESHAVISLGCQSSQMCGAALFDNNSCCCPTGETGTRYVCPDNWIYNTATGLCERLTTTGSDSTGYYNQPYGTCDPTTQEYPCYILKTGANCTDACLKTLSIN